MCTPNNTACGINFARALLRSHLLLMLRYVHRDHKDYYERGAQGGHLHFHTVLRLHTLKLCYLYTYVFLFKTNSYVASTFFL